MTPAFAGPGTVTVGPIANATTTTLALTAGTNPSNGGAALTFTATVAGTSPTGSVMFYDGLTLDRHRHPQWFLPGQHHHQHPRRRPALHHRPLYG